MPIKIMNLNFWAQALCFVSIVALISMKTVVSSSCFVNRHYLHTHEHKKIEHNLIKKTSQSRLSDILLKKTSISSEIIHEKSKGKLFHNIMMLSLTSGLHGSHNNARALREQPACATSAMETCVRQNKGRILHKAFGYISLLFPFSWRQKLLCLLVLLASMPINNQFTAVSGFQVGTDISITQQTKLFRKKSLITTDHRSGSEQNYNNNGPQIKCQPKSVLQSVVESVLLKNSFKNAEIESSVMSMDMPSSTAASLSTKLITIQPFMVAATIAALSITASVEPTLASAIAAARSAAAAAGVTAVALPVIDLSVLCMGAQHIFLTLLPTIVLALVQGGAAIMNYQNNFGDAPPPKTPAHGVVIAQSTSKEQPTGSPFFGLSKTSTPLEVTGTTRTANKDFLRLLVIGDSLAVGIGQSHTCTPVMPESIAKEISKATGKAVYWTCHGESGASTSWIVRMLQNSTEIQDDVEEELYKPPDFVNWEGKARRFRRNYFVNGTDQYAAAGLWTEKFKDNNQHPYSPEIWRQRLAAYRKNFDPAAMGPYDIVVLLTGPNDLKTMLFPFMLEEEDKKFHNKMKDQKPGVVDDLKMLMDVINHKVERRLQKTLDGWQEKAETLVQNICDRSVAMSDAIHILRSNQTISEKMEQTIQIPIDLIRAKADATSTQLRARAESISKAYKTNDTLPERVERGRNPLGKLKEKTFSWTDDIHEAAASAFKNLRHDLEDLERLFAITDDYSQILLSDEFANTSLAVEASTETVKPQIKLSTKSTSQINNAEKTQEEVSTTLDVVRPGKPLFVLPGMPARALPAFRKAPLSWFAVSVFDLLDKKKRQLAESNPDILFVSDPRLPDIIDYENRKGRVWKQIEEEQILLSLKDIGKVDCSTIEESMSTYFKSKNGFIDVQEGKPLSALPGVPGTKIFSVDRIHPNDYGYDCWGRHIGNSIVKQLQTTGRSNLVAPAQ